MSRLEVVARMKIRPGQLDAFKAQAAELARLTREKDTQTLRYDSFINEATMECEVHEAYLSEEGFMEHNQHIMEAREVLFHSYADDHRICVFGEVSPQLRQFFDQFGGVVTVFSFLMGLELSPAI
jgi:quinol monooxygenase YgiN